MNEVPTATSEQAPVSDELHRADQAHAQALQHLGEVVTGRPVVLANGEVATPKDLKAELQTREVQGHAYQR